MVPSGLRSSLRHVHVGGFDGALVILKKPLHNELKSYSICPSAVQVVIHAAQEQCEAAMQHTGGFCFCAQRCAHTLTTLIQFVFTQVIMPLINNWNDTGGVGDMVNWNGLPTHEAFFSDPAAMQTYKTTVAAILG